MKKASARGVRDGFVGDLEQLESFFHRTSAALRGTRHEKSDVSRLAVSVLTSAAVAFESFWSDLFIAYVNRRPAVYERYVTDRVFQSVRSKFGGAVADRVLVRSNPHLRLDEVERRLDPDGQNLTFATAAALSLRAREWLDEVHSEPITAMDAADHALYNAVKAVRNYAAHQSTRARESMNEVLSSADLEDALRRGQKHVIRLGPYLKAYVAHGNVHRRRVLIYMRRMQQVAERMDVS
ncbi:MAG: hypothetical protein AAGJ11_09895 [Bacteroidota bacterium]